MNERIKELAEQAELNATLLFNKDKLEKFAELILQECIKVARDQRDPANLNYKPSEQFVEALRLHFRFWA